MPYAYLKLKTLIKERYGTQRDFAEAIGASPETVSMKLSGKRWFSQADVERWAGVLGIGKGEYGEYFYT